MRDGDSYKGWGNYLDGKQMGTDVLRRKRNEKRRDIFFLSPSKRSRYFRGPLQRLVTLEVHWSIPKMERAGSFLPTLHGVTFQRTVTFMFDRNRPVCLPMTQDCNPWEV
jgi:hypothetical protein